MSRLIDADAIPWFVEGVGEIPVITKEEIDEMPVVPVVRCKECKWSHDGNCIKHGIAITDSFYCAGGERRD